MKKIMKDNPKKKLILQGGIIICVAAVTVMAVSKTIAWFTTSTRNDVEEITMEVSSSRSFDLSLDGINYGRDLKLKIFDNNSGNNLNTLLNDVSPIISQEVNGSKTNQSFKLYDPKKDEYTGQPITTNSEDWTQAKKTNFVFDPQENMYYVTNDSTNTADYIEFDLWVRSETELDIYLGNESYVKPTFTESDENYNYAVYQIDKVTREYDEKIYSIGGTIKGKVITDYLGDNYVYEYSSSTYSFKAIARNDGEGGYTYHDLNGATAETANADAAKLLIENASSYVITQGAKQASSTKSVYYAPDGIDKKLLGIVEVVNGVTSYYKTEEDYTNHTVSSLSNPFKLLSASPYTYEEKTKYADVESTTEICRFSKNLSAGAMRVAFSEVDVNSGANDNLKFVWNPQPNYKLTNAPNGAKVDIVNQNEDTYYYTTDGHGNYTQKSFSSTMSGFVQNGLINSTTDNPATGEKPLCSLAANNPNDLFFIRRLRVMVYLDGNDNEAQNPLLSSSSTGNGHVNIRLQFVSMYDNVIVEKQSEGNHTFTFAAHRSSEVNEGVVDYTNPTHTYTWSLSDTRNGTISTSTVTVGGKQMQIATVNVTRPGVLVVYATDDAGRVGTYTIVTNALNISSVLDEHDHKSYILTTSLDGVTLDNSLVEYSVAYGDVTINGNKVTFNSGDSAIIVAKYSDGIGTTVLSYSGTYD